MKFLLLVVFLAIFSTGVLQASPACSMTALYDTHADGMPDTLWKRGDTQSPVTAMQVDKRTGAKSFCIHGGYCYLAVVHVGGRSMEALRMTTCRVQPGDHGEDYGASTIYGLEGIPQRATSQPNKESVYDIQGVAGQCASESQVASGRPGGEVYDRTTPFHCDTAAVTFLDDHNKRIRIMFVDSDHIKDGKPLGFEGVMQSNGSSLKVSHMYFLSNDFRVETESESWCELYFERKAPKTFHCYAHFRGGDIDYAGEVFFNAKTE